MVTKIEGNTLKVGDIGEMSAENAAAIRESIRGALTDAITTLDVDLSATAFLDSSGLGALIALHKTMASRRGSIRVLHPKPTVQQILELTRLHRVLEIVN